MIFCFHKLDRVEKDGYQYCKKCGIAFAPPKLKCNHKWKHLQDVETFEHENKRPSYITKVLQCEHCGLLYKEEIIPPNPYKDYMKRPYG